MRGRVDFGQVRIAARAPHSFPTPTPNPNPFASPAPGVQVGGVDYGILGNNRRRRDIEAAHAIFKRRGASAAERCGSALRQPPSIAVR